MRDEFEYVNSCYGLSLVKNSRVVQPSTGRGGQVAKGAGHYIFIRWDDAKKPGGPYHPTDDLAYPGMAAAPRSTP